MTYEKETHIPRNEDCCNCVFGARDCGGLDFEAMKPVRTHTDGVIVVICEGRE